MTTIAMKPLDRSWFLLESDRVPVHGAFMYIYSPPASAKPGYARRVLASMKRRPVGAPFNLKADLSNPLAPRWEEVPVDLADHVFVTTLPAPGSRADLMKAATEGANKPLDNSKPLWRAHWFEGLADGGFAMLLVLHHAQWDGIAVFRLMREFMANAGAGNPVRAPWEGISTWKSLVSGERGGKETRGRSGRMRAVASLLGDAGHVGRDLSLTLAKQCVDLLTRKRDVPLPLAAPESRLDRTATSARNYGLATFEVDRVKAISKATETSFNDVLTAVIDAAYHGYLEEAGRAASKPLVALVPLAIKAKGAGNQITGAFVAMGEPGAKLRDRLSAVNRNMSAAKAQIGGMTVPGAKAWALLTMGIAAAPDVLKVGQRLPVTANMMVSNPYGIQERLFLGGCRLEQFAPLMGPSLGTRAMFGIYSYAETAFVSVTAFSNVIADVERFVELLYEAFDALEVATLGKGKRAPGKRRKGRVVSRAAAARKPRTRTAPRRDAD